MRLSNFGEVILSENDIIEGLYSGKIADLSKVQVEDQTLVDQFNTARKQNADPIPDLTLFKQTVDSLEDFDKNNQQNWFMGDYYREMDIEQWLLDRCENPVEMARVTSELELFRQHNMIDVLRYLKYLVDTMRYHNILWGVGRGSSVASYCLYKIGVHRIDSIKYELDIREFIK
jgi:DNA polymerase III alpha subunit